MTIDLVVNGEPVSVTGESATLLDVLREELGLHSPKDGCSPQGQCGCCTVLVDGAPRVACVTPVRRVAGRSITTVEGLAVDDRAAWGDAFCATGGSQCGFCTPGIVMRLEALRAGAGADADRTAINRALAAHLCRCTGWQTIAEAYEVRVGDGTRAKPPRDLAAAGRRATIEGHSEQHVAPDVALGAGGFAADNAPRDALVAVADGRGGWAVGETLAEARAAAGKVQGRRTTIDARPPLDVPAGDWALTLRTSWTEPGYLETDASWCLPGGEPVSPLANGGAFGAKRASPVPEAARRLADHHGRAVLVLLSREDTVRLGPKRPPIAAGLRADGSGVMRVVRTPGVDELMARFAPTLAVEQVDVPGPPTSLAPRAALWAELQVLRVVLEASGRSSADPITVVSPEGAEASVVARTDGSIAVSVRCGTVLDPVVLRSYVIGAVHHALGWVTSEAIAVDDDGDVHDLTIRSFGIVRPASVPSVVVDIDPSASGEAVNGSDAVFAATAAAVWRAQGTPPVWPTQRAL